jgi:hypothetical protein
MATVLGPTACHARPAGMPTGPRPDGPAQPRRRPARCTRAARALAWTPRAACARSGAVARSMAAWWGLAGGKLASTGGVLGWRRERRAEAGPTEAVGQWWGDGKWPAWWCSGGKAALAGWRRPRGGPAASGVGAGARERGPGRDGDSAAARHRAAAARPRRRCRATTARTRVPDERGWAFAGPCGQRRGAGVSAISCSTVRPIQFSNRINFISNGFKFAPNFD